MEVNSDNFTVKEILIDLSHRVDRAFDETRRSQEAQDKRISALEAWQNKVRSNTRSLGVVIASLGALSGAAYVVVSLLT